MVETAAAYLIAFLIFLSFLALIRGISVGLNRKESKEKIKKVNKKEVKVNDEVISKGLYRYKNDVLINPRGKISHGSYSLKNEKDTGIKYSEKRGKNGGRYYERRSKKGNIYRQYF